MTRQDLSPDGGCSTWLGQADRARLIPDPRGGHLPETRKLRRQIRSRGPVPPKPEGRPQNSKAASRVNGGRNWTRARPPEVEVVDHLLANERLTHVAIAWRRRNGCSSEKSVASMVGHGICAKIKRST
jgi:hypothetical protein